MTTTETRRPRTRLLAVFAAALCALVLAACGAAPGVDTAAAGGGIRTVNPYWGDPATEGTPKVAGC